MDPEASIPSISFDHDGFRLLVETSNDSTAGTLIDLIVTDCCEDCTVWRAIVTEDNLPKMGFSSLNAKHLIDYILDGKDQKEGCSLSLKKFEGTDVLLSIFEKKSERRPPFEIWFRLGECTNDEKLPVLQRVYENVLKEAAQIKEESLKDHREIAKLDNTIKGLQADVDFLLSEPLDDWSLSMSSRNDLLCSNTKESLLDHNLSRAAGTGSTASAWIQATFPLPVNINGVLLGMSNYYGRSRHLNGCAFQFSQDNKKWTTLFTVSGLDARNQKKVFHCSAYASNYRLIVTGKGKLAVGVGLMKFC